MLMPFKEIENEVLMLYREIRNEVLMLFAWPVCAGPAQCRGHVPQGRQPKEASGCRSSKVHPPCECVRTLKHKHTHTWSPSSLILVNVVVVLLPTQ